MLHLKHIIWDWNGTLLDDTYACVNAVNKMLADRGLAELTLQEYRKVFRFPVSEFYHEIGFVLEDENWDLMAAEFYEMFKADRSVALHRDTRSVLKELQDRGFVQSVLSASEQSILESMLADYKLDSYFQRIKGIDNMYGASKISMGRALIKELDVCCSEIIMIGDSLHDYEVAGDLEIGCILIAQGHQSFDRLATAGVPVLHSLSEVPELLGRISESLQ